MRRAAHLTVNGGVRIRAAAEHVDGYLWFGRPWLHMQADPFELQRALGLARTTPSEAPRLLSTGRRQLPDITPTRAGAMPGKIWAGEAPNRDTMTSLSTLR